MKHIFYILFLLPTLFSCQREKNVNGYPFFMGDINLNKDFGNKDVRICKPEKSFNNNIAISITYFETGKYDKALENFEKQSKVYDFAGNIYFKSKVSKIRNKDYLDLKMLALKTYDEGKTMKDGYTHHFNKVYRKQIAEL